MRVKDVVTDYLKENLKFDKTEFAVLNTDKFINCQLFLHLGVCSAPLDHDQQKVYEDTWLYTNNIMILENSLLRVYFPPLANTLITI